MIRLKKIGSYKLIETKRHTKILQLEAKSYAWTGRSNIGELVLVLHSDHKTDYILGLGEYRLYTVERESSLSNRTHLELDAGGKYWQGYIVLPDLPKKRSEQARIIPTAETLTS
jgi:hypothetical protein